MRPSFEINHRISTGPPHRFALHKLCAPLPHEFRGSESGSATHTSAEPVRAQTFHAGRRHNVQWKVRVRDSAEEDDALAAAAADATHKNTSP